MPTERGIEAAVALTQVGHGLHEGEPVTKGSMDWVSAAYSVVRQVAQESEIYPDVRLRDAKHPYYSSEMNYFTKEYPKKFVSWVEFKRSGWYDSDEDLNYLVRWDWISPDPDDYDGEPVPDHDELWLFFVLQRKGIYAPLCVRVVPADEEEIRLWLKQRWRTVRANWAPIR